MLRFFVDLYVFSLSRVMFHALLNKRNSVWKHEFSSFLFFVFVYAALCLLCVFFVFICVLRSRLVFHVLTEAFNSLYRVRRSRGFMEILSFCLLHYSTYAYSVMCWCLLPVLPLCRREFREVLVLIYRSMSSQGVSLKQKKNA